MSRDFVIRISPDLRGRPALTVDNLVRVCALRERRGDIDRQIDAAEKRVDSLRAEREKALAEEADLLRAAPVVEKAAPAAATV